MDKTFAADPENVLPREAHAILKLFPHYKAEHIIKLVIKNKHLEEKQRKLVVIKSLLDERDANHSQQLKTEADKIIKIFPEFEFKQIYDKLAAYDLKSDRINCFLRELVDDTETNALLDVSISVKNNKRKLGTDDESRAGHSKTNKLICVDDSNDSNIWKIRNAVDSHESLSSISSVHSSDSLIFNEGAVSSADVNALDMPSTSADYTINVPDVSNNTNKTVSAWITHSSMEKPQLESNNNDKENVSGGGYNLIKSISDIFPNLTKDAIKTICTKYTHDLHLPPVDNIMELIVSDIMDSSSPTDLINSLATVSEEILVQFNANARKIPVIIVNDDPVVDLNARIDEVVQEAVLEVKEEVVVEVEEAGAIALEASSTNEVISEPLLYHIMEMFPEADPAYLRSICKNKKNNAAAIDQVITSLFEMPDYPRREKRLEEADALISPEEQFEILKQVLPDADPSYLMKAIDKFPTQDLLKQFISNALEMRDYPTMQEYLRKQQLSAQTKQYTSEFDVEKFLALIPDPENYFRNKNLRIDRSDFDYCLNFLKNRYDRKSVNYIRSMYESCDDDVMMTCQSIESKPCEGNIASKRKHVTYAVAPRNIPLLQTLAYLSHKPEIEAVMEARAIVAMKERAEAKAQGTMQTCGCCFDAEVMLHEVVQCAAGCVFCKMCLERCVEVAFGEGKLRYPCMADCGEEFTLQTLQSALNAKLFSKMAQRKQLEEVKAAGIEELEACPFCDFATIPAPGDRLFRCLNSDCMKESCRQCREPSHVPLRCDEVERDSAVKNRLYIENKMTEALLRKCYKCGLMFIKADGCNKMTCSCGAKMCYVCKQPVEDYKHFNGQGGDKLHLCPLYSDTNLLHESAVLKGAEKAKSEISGDLKIDPTADLKSHFKEMRRQQPAVVPPGMHADARGHAAHVARLHDYLEDYYERNQLAAPPLNPVAPPPQPFRQRQHHQHHQQLQYRRH